MVAKKKNNTLAERLDWLFKNVLHPEGREYLYVEVQEETEKLGRKVTASYIGKLRRGEQNRPAWDVIHILAKFFNVPVTYFYREEMDEEELERLKIAAILQEEHVQEIAFRSRNLSSVQKEAILEILKGMATENGEDDGEKESTTGNE